jgi:Na+-driven multidrug efflux pump/anti-sigma regulatory factor (Ser/Thr protein kinase)
VSILALLILGIVIAIFGNLFIDNLLHILGAPSNIFGISKQYFAVYLLGMPFLFYVMSLSYFVRADGNAKLPFRALLLANVVNICLDIVFMKFLNFGISGAALATLIGDSVGCIYMSSYFLDADRTLNFIKVKISSFIDYIVSICKSGFSSSSTQLYLTIKLFVVNQLINIYAGDAGLVAFNMCYNSLFILYMFLIGTAQTMSPIVSVYYDEEDYNGVDHILKKSLKIVLASSLAFAVLIIICPQSLLLLYHVHDASHVPIVLNALRIFAVSYVGTAITFLYTFYAQAIQKNKLANMIAILEGLIVPVIAAVLLSSRMGADGIWISFTIAEAVTIIFIFAYSRYLNKKSKGEYSGFFVNKSNDGKGFLEVSINATIENAVDLSAEVNDYLVDNKHASIVSLAIEEMLTNIIDINDGLNTIDVYVKSYDDYILISIKDQGIEFNPIKENDDLSFDSISVLNRISDKIDYSRVLGLNSTVITIKN